MKKDRALYLSLMSLAVLFWGGAFVAIRVALLNGFSPGGLAFARYGLGALIVLPFLVRRYRPVSHLSFRTIVFAMFVGLCGIGFYGLCLNHGEVSLQAGIASFLISQESVMMVILAYWLLDEKTNPWVFVGVLLGIVGVGMITLSKVHHLGSLVSMAWVLVAAMFASLYNVLLRRIAPLFGAFQFTAYAVIVSAVLLACLYWHALLHDWPLVTKTGFIALLYLAIFPGIVSYCIINYVGAKLPIGQVGSMLFLIPLVANILGWLILGEVPTLFAFFGGLVTLLSAVWIQCVKR